MCWGSALLVDVFIVWMLFGWLGLSVIFTFCWLMGFVVLSLICRCGFSCLVFVCFEIWFALRFLDLRGLVGWILCCLLDSLIVVLLV